MERGNKKARKEHTLPLGPVRLGEVLPKEQMSIESKYLAKAREEHGESNRSLKKGHDTDQKKTHKSTESDPGSPIETSTPVVHWPRPKNHNQGCRSRKFLAELITLSLHTLGFLPDEALLRPNTEAA